MRTRHRLPVLSALALGGALATLAACAGPAPSPATMTSTSPVPPSARTPDDLLAAVLADYNVRNNAAIAADRTGDPSLWANADTEGVLDGDLFDAKLYAALPEAAREPKSTGRYLYEPVRALGTTRAEHPRWVIALVSARQDPAPTTAAATPEARFPREKYAVFVQAAVDGPWLMAQGGMVHADQLPAGPGGPDPSTGELANATAAADRIGRWLTSGAAEPGFDPARLTPLRQRLVSPTEDRARAELTCSLYARTPVATGVNPGVRIVRVGQGWVGAAAFACTQTSIAPRGRSLSWQPGWSAIFPAGDGRSLTRPLVIDTVFTLSADATSSVLVGIEGRGALP